MGLISLGTLIQGWDDFNAQNKVELQTVLIGKGVTLFNEHKVLKIVKLV